MQNPQYVAYLCYAISLGIIVSHLWRSLRRSKGQDCEPAITIPSRWPLQLDVFWRMKRAMREQRLMPLMTAWHENYGDTFQCRIFGETTLFTRDSRNIKALLSSDFLTYELGPRNDILRPLIGHSIFTQDGKAWEFSRAFLRPHFANPLLLDTATTERHIQTLLSQFPCDTFDLQPLLTELVGDIAVDTTCGDTPANDRHAFSQALSEAQTLLALSPQMSQLWARLPVGRIPIVLSKCRGFMMKAAEGALHRRKLFLQGRRSESKTHASKPRVVFADAFAAHCSDPIVIRDQLHSLVFAGRDTMVRLLSWTFWCLARYPEYFHKLQVEITAAFKENVPQGDPLISCRYLEWIMKEVMRLYPPISINVRHALTDTYLPTGGGPDGTARVFVPKAGAVNYITFALQRRKDLFGADADEFRPERWADSSIGHNYSYLPFSAGPRVCLGQKYAMRQCAYIIVRILQHVESLGFGGDMNEEVTYALGFSLGIGKGCPIRVKLKDS